MWACVLVFVWVFVCVGVWPSVVVRLTIGVLDVYVSACVLLSCWFVCMSVARVCISMCVHVFVCVGVCGLCVRVSMCTFS